MHIMDHKLEDSLATYGSFRITVKVQLKGSVLWVLDGHM